MEGGREGGEGERVTILLFLQSGLMVVWKVDAVGKLNPLPLHQHRLQSSVSHSVMVHPNAIAKELSDASKGRGSVLDTFSWRKS